MQLESLKLVRQSWALKLGRRWMRANVGSSGLRQKVDLGQLWVKWYALPSGSGPTLGQVDLVRSGSGPRRRGRMVWAGWLDGLGWDIFPFSDIFPSTFTVNSPVKWIWAISVLVARWIWS